jgi:EmrB/QacA subfamily drug resistance transporter
MNAHIPDPGLAPGTAESANGSLRQAAEPEEEGQSLVNVSAFHRFWTLFVGCGGAAVVIGSMIALNTGLADIAVATGATQNQLTWIVDSYTLVLACLLLPAGAVGDRYGRRGALMVGLAVFAAASFAPLHFHSALQIVAARSVSGAGAAFILPATLSLLTGAFPVRERSKVVGAWAGIVGSAGVGGLIGTGLLLNVFQWQSIFWALGLASLVLLLASFTVADSREHNAPPLDWIGAITIGAAVALLVFGILRAPTDGWTNPRVYCCLLAGIVVALGFCRIELRRRYPLLDVRLFLDPEFGAGALTITVVFGATFGLFFVVTQYIQQVMGYSALGIGLALSPLAIPLITFSALSPWYVPRLGLRLVIAVSLVVTAIGFLYLRTLGVGSTFKDLFWPLIVVSTGFGLCTAPTTSAIMTTVSEAKQGVASAVNDTTREVGGAIGIALSGSVLASVYSHHIAGSIASLPGPVRGAASGSLAHLLAVADRLGPPGKPLVDAGKRAFIDGANWAYLIMAAVVACAAVVISMFAPGRDGQQIRLIQWLTQRARRRRTSI